MTRLPSPGRDAGTWGNILNDYLSQSHNSDGTLKDDSVGTAQLQPDSVDNTILATSSVSEVKLDSGVTTKLNREFKISTASDFTAVSPIVGQTITVTQVTSGQPSAFGLTTLPTSSGVATSLPLFNVEDYGAVGDGATDDYAAVKAAWNAMLAAPTGGLLFFPRAVTYRVDASIAGRVVQSADDAYALFPLPMLSPEGALKRPYGVLGVGNPYAVRTASSFGIGGNAKQVATAAVLFVDYSTSFAWSGSLGLPSVFGAPDADITGHTSDNIISNMHFSVEGIIIRQPNNPSLCGMNLEMVSTVDIKSVRFDVNAVLDQVAEPTHPTGASLLAPKSNNNVAVLIDRFVAEGHYTGVPYTEHIDARSAIVLRCKIGVSNRRQCSHFGTMHMLKIEQCPYGLAGYDPAGAAPNLGIVAWFGGTVIIDFYDAEDYAYEARVGNSAGVPWIYTPTAGAHIYAPNGGLSGQIRYSRVNSEPAPPTGIGIAPFGANSDIYLNGNIDSGLGLSGFAIYSYTGDGVPLGQRHLGNPPSNGGGSAPDAPTIGTATAGVLSASVAFTPAGSGAAATSFTATSTPGGITGTNTVSPITVSGLTAGTPYTFTVHATNGTGNSAESSASNSVSPTSGGGPLPSDNFNRADASSLGTSSSGTAWNDPNAAWGIFSNQGRTINATDTFDPAWLATGQTDITVSADVTLPGGEGGIFARFTDASNYVYLDLTRADGANVNVRIYNRVGGTFSGQGNVNQVAWATGVTRNLKLQCSGTTFASFVDNVQIDQVTIASQSGTGAGIIRLAAASERMLVDNFLIA